MRRAAVFAALVLSGGCAAAAQLAQGELPSLEGLGRIGQQALPLDADHERAIGFGIAATVAGRWPLAQDEALTRYVNLVGQSVAQQSVRAGEVDFHFGVLATDDVNAFAAPGGYIFLTRGALAMMESEAELAGVLAHEIGHVDQKHVVEAIRRSSVFQQARDEAQLQGALLDQLAAVGSTLLFTGLSRTDELEADSLGVLYATAAGYRTDGLVGFLRRLQAAEGRGTGTLREWTATHPSTAERIQIVQRQLGGAPPTGADGAARFRRSLGR